MNILLFLFSVYSTTEQITYQGIRNLLDSFNVNFVKYVSDSEERTIKYINNLLEEKSRQDIERQNNLQKNIEELLKKHETKDSLLNLLPLLNKTQNNEEALLSLLTNKAGDSKMPLLLYLMNKSNTQIPPNLLVTLFNNTGDNETLVNYLLYQKLTEQNQSCPQAPNQAFTIPQGSNQAFNYGPTPPTFNTQPASYGPAPEPRVIPNCPLYAETCPTGVETREYGRNYGKRP
ncbi:putative SP-containing protein [Vairimorpha necatrix]|uniref:SP-containing protein n=1 Tax=Vairimorpha necatrix TaxID=6039 RepID=A0AAX4JFS8_9MICR